MKAYEKVLPYAAGMVMAFIFGLSFLFSKQGLADLTPMVLLAWRFGIAALILTALLLMKVIRVELGGKPLGAVVLLSAFYPAASFVFETTGLQYTSTSQAGIMVSLMPILVSLLGLFILKEKPSAPQWAFIGSSVLGVFITVVFAGSTGDSGSFFGLILLLISIVGGSAQNVLSRKSSAHFTPVEITFVMIWLGAIFFNSLAVLQGIFRHNLAQTYWVPLQSVGAMQSVLYLGVLASVVAFFCMNYMLSRLKAANAAVFTNLATVVSILAGVVLLHEKLQWYQVLGGLFIIAGVWGTNYCEVKAKKQAEL